MTKRNRRYALLLLSFFALAYILPLGARDLVVPDETRYGEIPREMIADGDWVVPHLDGVRYFEKPVLGYWVHAAAIGLLGENNFAVRLPSALAVGLSALLIYILSAGASGRGDPDDAAAAILAPLVFFSCFEVFGVGNTAVLDNLFSFFLTACIAAFYLATEATPGSARERGLLILAGLACGLAFLTKGFLAVAVPVMTLVPYLVWQRRFADLLRMGWLPILGAVVVALPWSLAIHAREPDFWRFFFWNEHIRRFMGDDAQHKESFWFFFLTAPGMFIPWTFLVPAALPGIRDGLGGRRASQRLLRLCICWLTLPFLFFSFSNGKLLTYILPCFAPFAVLMASGLSHGRRRADCDRLFRWGTAVGAGLFSLILAAFLCLQLLDVNGLRPFDQPWKTVMAVDGLGFFLLSLIWALRSRDRHVRNLVFGCAPLLLFFIAHYTIPDRTLEVKCPASLLMAQKTDIGPDDIVISDEEAIRAVCWYLKRSNVYVIGAAGELDYGLRRPEADGRWLDVEAAGELIRHNPGKTVLIARARNMSRWHDRLPPPLAQGRNGPRGYVLSRY